MEASMPETVENRICEFVRDWGTLLKVDDDVVQGVIEIAGAVRP